MRPAPLPLATLLALTLPACGEPDPLAPDAGPSCDLPLGFAAGGDGHADPLGAGPGEARAGRLRAEELPPDPDGLASWRAGDFVLANDRIALVIEAAGPSDFYDPWGGRPAGWARVADGALVEAAAPVELLVLTGRHSVVTTTVSVLADGSDGRPAIVRAAGPLAPTPFWESIMGALFRADYDDVPTAIDYVLEPGAEHIDVWLTHQNPRLVPAEQPALMHAFLFAARTPAFIPGLGFGDGGELTPLLGFVDEAATSLAYAWPGGDLDTGIDQSGFAARFTDGFVLPPCEETRRHHARLTIGGPGLDGLLQAIARDGGAAPLRAIAGTVRDAAGAPAAGVRVHAETVAGGYLTRAASGADGRYALHVPPDAEVTLTAWRRGDAVVGPLAVPAAAGTFDLALAPAGLVRVTVTGEDGLPLPARVQLLPAGGTPLPAVPARFGEPAIAGGRLHVAYATSGEVALRAPAGDWEVIVSRGYEYELHRETVAVAGGETVEVAARLVRAVATPGVQCADLHVHTHLSPDSGDDAREKVASAVADGLEIPARSDHEYVASFQPLLEELGLERWAFGIGSIELTTTQTWGHMGVFPLDPDPGAQNGGAPRWQRTPTAEDPTAPVETIPPPEVFAAIRARPERPTIVINHPRSSPTDYFEYAGYDPATGLAAWPEVWDEEITLIEVFNGSGWLANRGRTVVDWLSLLDRGRRVFAVGSSDTHTIAWSPVGYPRTCLAVGTDEPSELTAELVRDAATAGRAFVSGGIYLDARVGDAGPGDVVTGLGETALVRLRVSAATWIDVSSLEIVVDGASVETRAIDPADADPADPAVRLDVDVEVPVAAGADGSYVVFAAWGDARLDPVHPGRVPFGVTNPIFLRR